MDSPVARVQGRVAAAGGAVVHACVKDLVGVVEGLRGPRGHGRVHADGNLGAEEPLVAGGRHLAHFCVQATPEGGAPLPWRWRKGQGRR